MVKSPLFPRWIMNDLPTALWDWLQIMKAYFNSWKRIKVLTYLYLGCQSVLRETATFKSRIYVLLWCDKNTANLWQCGMFCLWWCLSSQMSSFGSCLGSDSGIPLNKHACFFREKRESQSSQHNITAPRPTLISFINLQLPPLSVCAVSHDTFILTFQKNRPCQAVKLCNMSKNVILDFFYRDNSNGNFILIVHLTFSI